MARRIPLPRLTQRQRLAKWQRERRQQAIYLGVFTVALLFALGLAGWAAASQYYEENLKPAARIDGRAIPLRDFNKRLAYERIRFFAEAGIPEGAEGNPQVRSFLIQLRKTALDGVVMNELLLDVAREEHHVPSVAEARGRLERDFGELHVRHVLAKVDDKAEDKQRADADARTKAEAIAAQLRADPRNAGLWQEVAAQESGDTGTKDKGGDLGWVSTRSNFTKEFEDAMYALADGAISDPVKSPFGYHVIQRIESRSFSQTPFVARLKKAGLGEDDLAAIARGTLLHDRYERERREAEVPSPQEQVRLGVVVVNLPTVQQSQAYLDAIRKINQVVEAFEKGTDLREIASTYSDDLATKEKGGELGWVTRSLLPNARVADNVFSLNVGERSQQHALPGNDIAIYKVLEKDPAREVTEEQKTRIREGAFTLWVEEQERRLSVLRLVPGLEF